MTTEEFAALAGGYVSSTANRLNTKAQEKKAKLQQKHDQSLYGVTTPDGQYWDDADSSTGYRLQGGDAPEVFHDNPNLRKKVYEQVAYDNQIPLDQATVLVDQQAQARKIDQEYRDSAQFLADKQLNPDDPYYQSRTMGEGIGLTGGNKGDLTSFDIYHAGDMATKAGRDTIARTDWDQYKTGEKGFYGRELLDNPEYVNKMISEGYMTPGEADDMSKYAEQLDLYKQAKEKGLGLHGQDSTVDERVLDAMQKTSYSRKQTDEYKQEVQDQADFEYAKATQGWIEGTTKAAASGFVKEAFVDFADWVGDTTNLYDIGDEASKSKMVNKWMNYVPTTSQETVQQVEGLNNIVWDSNQDMSTRIAAAGKSVFLAAQDGELLGSSLGMIGAWVAPGMILTKGHKLTKTFDKIDGLVDKGKLTRAQAAGQKTKHMLLSKDGINYGLKKQSGMITGALGNVNDQYETFVANNNGVELQGAEKAEWFAKSFGVQMLNQNLDAITAISIMKSPGLLQAAKQSVQDISEKAFGKLVVNMSKGVGSAIAQMPKEAAQEYTQGMMELYNERYGAEEFKDTDTFVKFITNPEFAKEKTVDALLGAGGSLQFSAIGMGKQAFGKGLDKAKDVNLADTFKSKETIEREKAEYEEAAPILGEIDQARTAYNMAMEDADLDTASNALDAMEDRVYNVPSAERKKINREIRANRKQLDSQYDSLLDQVAAGNIDALGSGPESINNITKLIGHASKHGKYGGEVKDKIYEAARKLGIDTAELDTLTQDTDKLNEAIASLKATTPDGEIDYNTSEGVRLEVLYGNYGAYTYAQKLLKAVTEGDQGKTTTYSKDLTRLLEGQQKKLNNLNSIVHKRSSILEGEKGVIEDMTAELQKTNPEVTRESLLRTIVSNKLDHKVDGPTVQLTKAQWKRIDSVLKADSITYAEEKAVTGSQASNKGIWKSSPKEPLLLYLNKHNPEMLPEQYQNGNVPILKLMEDIKNESKVINKLYETALGDTDVEVDLDIETESETATTTETEVDQEPEVTEETPTTKPEAPIVEPEPEVTPEKVDETPTPKSIEKQIDATSTTKELKELYDSLDKGTIEKAAAGAALGIQRALDKIVEATTQAELKEIFNSIKISKGNKDKVKGTKYEQIDTISSYNAKVNELTEKSAKEAEVAKIEGEKEKKEVTKKLDRLEALKTKAKELNAELEGFNKVVDDTWEAVQNLKSEKKAITSRLRKLNASIKDIKEDYEAAKELLKNPSLDKLTKFKKVFTHMKNMFNNVVNVLIGIVNKHDKLIEEKANAKTRLEEISEAIKHEKWWHEVAKKEQKRIKTKKEKLAELKKEATEEIKAGKYRNKLITNSKKTTGLLNLDKIVQTSKKDSSLLSEYSVDSIENKKLEELANEGVATLEKVLPQGNSKKNSWAKGNNTTASKLIYDNNEQIDKNVATALMMAINDYIGTSSAELEMATDNEIATMINKSPEEITSEDRMKYGGLGKQNKYLAKTLAGKVTKLLGIAPLKELRDKEGNVTREGVSREDYAAFEAGLGQYAILMMNQLGFTKANSINTYEFVKDTQGKEAADKLTGEAKKASILLTQLADEYRKYGKAPTGMELAQETEVDFDNLVDVEVDYVDYIDELVDYEVNYEHKVSKIAEAKATSKELMELLLGSEDSKWPRSKAHNGQRKVGIRNNEVMSVPAKTQKVINKVENQQHNMRVDVVSKLIGNEGDNDRARKVAQLKYSMGYRNADKMVGRATKEDVEAQRGVNQGIDKEVNMLVEFYDKLQKGEVTNELYFDYFYARNGRLMIDNNTINPQSGKQLHRFIFPPANAVDKITKVDSKYFKKAIAQAFGYSIDKKSDKATEEFADAILEAELSEIYKGIETLMRGAKHAAINGVEVEIEFLGQMVVARESIEAHKEAKKNRLTTFKSSLMLETDAKTNGFGIKLRQFPFGDVAEDSKWQLKAGMVTGWSTIRKYNGKGTNEIFGTEGFFDSYQTIVNEIEEIDGLLGELSDKLSDAEKLYEGSSDTGVGKGLHDVREFMELVKGTKYIPTMKDNGAITKAARDLAKDPFMTKNYGSGYLSTKRSVGSALSGGVLTDFIKHVQGGQVSGGHQLEAMVMKLVNKTNPDMTAKEVAKSLATGGENSVRVKLTYVGQVKDDGARVIQKEEREYGLATAISNMYSDVYGEAVNSKMKTMMAHFDDANADINDAFRIMYRLFAEAYEAKLDEATKDGKGLSKEANLRLIQETLATFPKVKGLMSEDHEGFTDYISIFDEEMVKTLNDKILVSYNKEGKETSISVKAIIHDLVEAGNSGSVIPIHTFDGGLMTKLLEKYGFTNVFDAIVAEPELMGKIVEEYNELMIEANKEWSFYKEVADSLGKAVEAATPEAIAMVNKKNSAGEYKQQLVDEKFKPISVQAKVGLITANAEANQAKKEIMEKEPVVSGHMVLDGDSQYSSKVVFKDKEDIINQLSKLNVPAIDKVLKEIEENC